MGLIHREVTITGLKQTLPIRALLDSGAVYNHVRCFSNDGTRVESIGVSGYKRKRPGRTATGEEFLAPVVVFPKMNLLGRDFPDPQFLVMENLEEELIVGAATMQAMGIVLEPRIHEARITR
jgi:hypothetical protein